MDAELAVNQYWSGTRLPISAESGRLYAALPQLGIVIGTFASVPYVHLQLEARRRLFPNVPALVHDDGSPHRETLLALCRDYGADFESNSQRLPHHLGDLSAFLGGLKWAPRKGIELLLKVSRRWIFVVDWRQDLQDLAMQTQAATFSNYTKSYAFGFRTECIGMAVKLWSTPRVIRSLVENINKGQHVFVENYVHQFAIHFDESNCSQADRWKGQHPVPEERRGYVPWPLMGTDRIDPNPSGKYLWHDSHAPAAYASQAAKWGLPYGEADFADPNQGCGSGPPNASNTFSKPSAWKGLESEYQWLLNGLSPVNTIVEIGVDYGWSLFHFAKDFPRAAVYGVDSYIPSPDVDHPDAKDFVLQEIRKFPNVQLSIKTSELAAAEFDGIIDLLHIDADHAYESVRRDFELWSPKVRSGGCVLFHDVESSEGVRRFFNELQGRKSQITAHYGLGCWYKA